MYLKKKIGLSELLEETNIQSEFLAKNNLKKIKKITPLLEYCDLCYRVGIAINCYRVGDTNVINMLKIKPNIYATP